MLRRETERDDRQGNERGRGGNGAGGRLRKGVAVVAAALAVLLPGRRDRRERAEPAGGRGPLADVAARVRERAALDAEAPAPDPAPDPEAERATDLPRSVRRVADDPRVRKGAPLAAALLAGALLAGRRDGDESAETDAGDATAETGTEPVASTGTDSEAAAATPAIERVYRSAPSVDEEVDEKRERRAEASAGDREDDGETETAAPAAEVDATDPVGIDADADELSPPTARGMPMLGLGTYQDADYDECVESVRRALDIGYRHLDATERREAYYNEEAVGDAVSESHLDREELFVATKVDPNDLEPDHVSTSVEESLDRLGMEYVDLLYVHWPTGEYEAAATLDAFAELRREGLTEEIGVSNFTVELLAEAIEVSDEPIFANQVEMHPLLPQAELREFCESEGVELVAYSPIARGDVEDVDELQEVAAKHDATPAQVSLAWLREKGVTAIPESTSADHLRENWLSLGLDLDAADVEKLDAIERRERIVDPDDAPWNR